MLQKAQTILESKTTTPITYIHSSYAAIQSILDGKKADFILLDIGVNMEHFKDGERGFSIHESALLDMRFDTGQ